MRLTLFQPDMAPNCGAAIRLAGCFGVGLDIIEPCGFPLQSRDIRRVAMDYEKMTPVRRHISWEAFCQSRERQAGRVVLLTTKAATPLWDFQFQPTDMIMTGRESAGAPDEVHEAVDARIIIPLSAQARSFNLVNSAAIALGEASRQLGLDAIAG